MSVELELIILRLWLLFYGSSYFLMRSGQGGSEKEGLIQSHPIDKLHMDNRLTDQGVEEVRSKEAMCNNRYVHERPWHDCYAIWNYILVLGSFFFLLPCERIIGRQYRRSIVVFCPGCGHIYQVCYVRINRRPRLDLLTDRAILKIVWTCCVGDRGWTP